MKRKSPSRRGSGLSSQDFSVIVLAGGFSSRIGRDKAFLRLGGQAFVSLIVGEMSKVFEDIIVVIGSKKASDFSRILPDKISIVPDSYRIMNPMGGMLTGFDTVSREYAAVLACDLPLAKHEVLRFVCNQALGHSAAVPIWENGDTEPLCAAYRVSEAGEAAREALQVGKIGPKQILPFLSDVRYVPVSRLRHYDRDLDSLTNVNTQADYKRVRERYRQAIGAHDRN